MLFSCDTLLPNVFQLIRIIQSVYKEYVACVCVCVCVLHINLSGPNHSAVADPVRGLLDSREKKQPAQDKNKRPSSIEKNKKIK